jgi:Histidine kinase
MNAERIDWSQLWYPGPTRVFTPAEMARAGGDRPSRTFLMVMAVNLLGPAVALMFIVPPGETLRLLALLAGGFYLVWRGAMALWRRPTRARLMVLSLVALALFIGFVLALRWRMPAGPARIFFGDVAGAITAIAVFGYWFLSLFRSHQIAARLRELDERDRAVEMARQLATAQVQPHFIFNTLAALQHWVDTGDARASPLLRSLSGYLRAVLPLFQAQRLALGDELAAVQRYLEVMQARLGEKLAFTIDADAAARAAMLPPGIVLTLVENAVEHGVQQSLGAATLQVQARCDRGRLELDVADSGPGLPEPLVEGLGLQNTRGRLVQAYGDAAQLQLQRRPEGGTLARLEIPAS